MCTLWGKIKIPSCFLFLRTILLTLTTQWLKEKLNNTTLFTPKQCETHIHIHPLLLNILTLRGLKKIIVVTAESCKFKAGKDLREHLNPSLNSMVEKT